MNWFWTCWSAASQPSSTSFSQCDNEQSHMNSRRRKCCATAITTTTTTLMKTTIDGDDDDADDVTAMMTMMTATTTTMMMSLIFGRGSQQCAQRETRRSALSWPSRAVKGHSKAQTSILERSLAEWTRTVQMLKEEANSQPHEDLVLVGLRICLLLAHLDGPSPLYEEPLQDACFGFE